MQFLLYCLCGGLGVLSDLLIYYMALSVKINYQLANLTGYACGTIVSFFLNRAITFDVRDRVKSRFLLFISVAGVGYIVSATFLWLLVEYLAVDKGYAKIATLPCVLVLQFTLNKIFTFQKKPLPSQDDG